MSIFKGPDADLPLLTQIFQIDLDQPHEVRHAYELLTGRNAVSGHTPPHSIDVKPEIPAHVPEPVRDGEPVFEDVAIKRQVSGEEWEVMNTKTACSMAQQVVSHLVNENAVPAAAIVWLRKNLPVDHVGIDVNENVYGDDVTVYDANDWIVERSGKPAGSIPLWGLQADRWTFLPGGVVNGTVAKLLDSRLQLLVGEDALPVAALFRRCDECANIFEQQNPRRPRRYCSHRCSNRVSQRMRMRKKRTPHDHVVLLTSTT